MWHSRACLTFDETNILLKTSANLCTWRRWRGWRLQHWHLLMSLGRKIQNFKNSSLTLLSERRYFFTTRKLEEIGNNWAAASSSENWNSDRISLVPLHLWLEASLRALNERGLQITVSRIWVWLPFLYTEGFRKQEWPCSLIPWSSQMSQGTRLCRAYSLPSVFTM